MRSEQPVEGECGVSTVKLFNFASDLFLNLRGRYYLENKSPQKLIIYIIANGKSWRNAKINRRELTCLLQYANINSREVK